MDWIPGWEHCLYDVDSPAGRCVFGISGRTCAYCYSSLRDDCRFLLCISYINVRVKLLLGVEIGVQKELHDLQNQFRKTSTDPQSS